MAPRNVTTWITPFDPVSHTAPPPSTAAVAAHAAIATSDRRPRHGATSSVASTSGHSLNAVPIASAQPSAIGRSLRQAATATIAAAVDHASTRLNNSPSTGTISAPPVAAAALPHPQNSAPMMIASAMASRTTIARPNEGRPPGSRASSLNTSSVPAGCST